MLGSKTILMLVKKIISISKGSKFEGYYRFKKTRERTQQRDWSVIVELAPI